VAVSAFLADGSISVLRECGGGAGMFRTGLVDGVELALISLVLAVAIRAVQGLHQSACPVQAAPDKGSCLVKLGPAGDG
jgi:hypothetical protein